MQIKGITVYCASSPDIDKVYFDAARQLGGEIARAGLPVIDGGGRRGLMGAVNDGALAAGGVAVGVIPGFMVEQDLQHHGLTHMITTPDMATRKRTLLQMSMGVVALPGGVGTFEELFEAMTTRKLGMYDGEIVILNINHYYDPLIQLLDKAKDEGFSYGRRTYSVADTVDQALDIILKR